MLASTGKCRTRRARWGHDWHLDVQVPAAQREQAQQQVLDLGATRLPGSGADFLVYSDPVGHPFCLVW